MACIHPILKRDVAPAGGHEANAAGRSRCVCATHASYVRRSPAARTYNMQFESWDRNPQISIGLVKEAPAEFFEAIRDATLRAFHEHGAAAFAAPRRAAAAHEAGHAIVGTAEGLRIRSLTVFPQSAPGLGEVWGGRCMEASGKWASTPDTSADENLSRARFYIAGLAAEALTRLDKPGSSVDELALSQTLAHNAGLKLEPTLSYAERAAYEQQIWHEQVWEVALAILRTNRAPFQQLASHFCEHEFIDGKQLHKILAAVERRAVS
jgi:hypothetical protein